MYSPADIRRLGLLRQAVLSGQNISNAAKLDTRQLEALSADAARESVSSEGAENADIGLRDAGHYLDRCLSAVLDLEADQLESALNDAAVDLTRLSLMTDVVSALFDRIGRLWADGSIKIVNEHMASSVTQGFLWDMLRSATPGASAPAMVVATPSGQWCQIGALMVAVAGTDSGWHAHYFGPDMPAEEIAAAVKHKQARLAALSITFQAEQNRVIRELKKLKSCLPPDVSIVVGGIAAYAYRQAIEAVGGRRYRNLREFIAELSTWPSTHQPAPAPL